MLWPRRLECIAKVGIADFASRLLCLLPRKSRGKVQFSSVAVCFLKRSTFCFVGACFVCICYQW